MCAAGFGRSDDLFEKLDTIKIDVSHMTPDQVTNAIAEYGYNFYGEEGC